MPTNYYLFFLTALIPLIVGAVYYHDKVFGSAWKKVNGFSDEDLAGANMLVIFGSTYFLGVLLSVAASSFAIHQPAVFQMMMPEVMVSGSAAEQQFLDLMKNFGEHHRSFSHGAIHGGIMAVFFALPLLAINALFERRGWKYVFIHLGYWFICLILIGGILCETLIYL
ncbi:MAG: DUF1761 domain-containing protein [Saprospiraceae bacterium]